MSTTTPNLGLSQPQMTDQVNLTIPQLANDMLILDTAVGGNSSGLAALQADTIQRAINVMSAPFNAKGDGVTDDTIALKAALQYAKDNGIKKVFAPDGNYLLTPFNAAVAGEYAKTITVEDGITLEGNGYNTVFKFNSSIMSGVENGAWRLFLFKSNTQFNNFRIDGNKGAVNSTGLTGVESRGLYSYADGTTNVHMDKLWIHDIFGVAKEGFGASFRNADNNCSFKNIEAWNIVGTGLHVPGDYLSQSGPYNILVEDCILHDNTFMGISVFAGQETRLINIEAYNNAAHGINLEWTDEIDIINPKLYANGNAGIGTYGKANFRVFDGTIQNNNTLGGWGEIKLLSSDWFTGNAQAWAATTAYPINSYVNANGNTYLCITSGTSGSTAPSGTGTDITDGTVHWKYQGVYPTFKPIGTAGVVEINNTKVKILSGSSHIYIEVDDTVTIGKNVPDRIIINTQDSKDWTIRTEDDHDIRRDNLATMNIFYGNLKIGQPLVTKKLLNWSPSGGVTVKPYTGTAFDSSPIQIVATAQFNTLNSDYVLKPNSRYLIRVRTKNEDAYRWDLVVRDSAGVILPSWCILGYGNVTKGQFMTGEFIAITGSANDWRMQIQVEDAITGTATLTVDYLSVYELVSDRGDSKGIRIGNGSITYGTAIPTNGTWRKRDIIFNDSALYGSAVGWVNLSDGLLAPLLQNIAYAVGSNVLPTTNNGHAYTCTVNGTSTGVQPTWPTGTGATVQDTGGTTTWAASTAYFASAPSRVLPTVSNGFWYRCTGSGTSGATQPTWPTTEGATVVDGTATWTAFKIVTWQEAGTSANFQSWGQIGVMTSIGSAPQFVGQVAVVGAIVYTAVGTALAADWKQTSN